MRWMDPFLLSLLEGLIPQLAAFGLGIFVLELKQTVWFEWALCKRRMALQWAYVPYILGRLFLLMNLVITTFANHIVFHANCTALIRFNSFAGHAALGCATMNIALRTAVIWSHRVSILVFLGAAIVGHWTLLMASVPLSIGRDDVFDKKCVYTSTNSASEIVVLFVYTISLDFVILVLQIAGLISNGGESTLKDALVAQGTVYFLSSFLANLVPAIVISLDLTPAMTVIFASPSTVASVIASSRAVTSLLSLKDGGPSQPILEAAGSSDVMRDTYGAQLSTQITLPMDDMSMRLSYDYDGRYALGPHSALPPEPISISSSLDSRLVKKGIV